MAKKKRATKKKSASVKKATSARKSPRVKKASPKKGPPAKKSPSQCAEAVEAQLAQVDKELLKLLQSRAKLFVKGVKQGQRAAGFQADSGDVLSQLVERSRGPLSPQSVRAIFRELLSGCRLLVRDVRVAFLGPQYSYSHLAALHRFGQSVEYIPVGSIPAVFEEVNRRHSDFGLVPIENSTDGRIVDTLDMFTRLPVKIRGQIEMAIHHTLLGKCARTDVTEVYSRPQALSQCRNWLAKHLPAARTIEVTSTSTAAQLAKEKPGAAAVASLQAGVHYGLDVLAERIEDNSSNVTRFAVIGHEPADPTGNDRTALLFQLEHEPGSLAEAMNVFKRNGVNLTWIESFPIPGSDRAYYFFVEMEGHQADKSLSRSISTIGRNAIRLEVLGSFPASVAID